MKLFASGSDDVADQMYFRKVIGLYVSAELFHATNWNIICFLSCYVSSRDYWCFCSSNILSLCAPKKNGRFRYKTWDHLSQGASISASNFAVDTRNTLEIFFRLSMAALSTDSGAACHPISVYCFGEVQVWSNKNLKQKVEASCIYPKDPWDWYIYLHLP